MARKRKDYAAELVRLRTGRDVPDLLRDLYIDRRHSQQEIADALGVSRAQVVYWMRDIGIGQDDRPPLEIETVA